MSGPELASAGAPAMRPARLIHIVVACAMALACETPPFHYPPGPPVIERFDAEPFSVLPGQSALLSWTVQGADRVELAGIADAPIEVTASDSLGFAPAETRTVDLIATGPGGTSRSRLTLIVQPTEEVFISELTVTPSAIEPPETINVRWTALNASHVEIRFDDEIHLRRGAASGTLSLEPLQSGFVELRAFGIGGPKTERRSVVVATLPPLLDFFELDPSVIRDDEIATLRWQFRRAASAKISVTTADTDAVIFDPAPPEGELPIPGMVGSARFVLELGGFDGSTVSEEIFLRVLPPANPQIISFVVTPTVTGPFGEVLAFWSVLRADRLELRAGAGPAIILAPGTTSAVVRADTSTTPIQLTALADGASAISIDERTITLTVDQSRPQIVFASASPTRFVFPTEVRLDWETSNADRTVVSTEVGAQLYETTSSTGTFSFTPSVTTTVLLQANNPSGSTSRFFTLERR